MRFSFYLKNLPIFYIVVAGRREENVLFDPSSRLRVQTINNRKRRDRKGEYYYYCTTPADSLCVVSLVAVKLDLSTGSNIYCGASWWANTNREADMYVYTRRFAPRVAYAARYARSGREKVPGTSIYAKRTEVHD